MVKIPIWSIVLVIVLLGAGTLYLRNKDYGNCSRYARGIEVCHDWKISFGWNADPRDVANVLNYWQGETNGVLHSFSYTLMYNE